VRHLRFPSALLLLCLFALAAVAACGGDDEENGEAGTPTPAVSPAPGPPSPEPTPEPTLPPDDDDKPTPVNGENGEPPPTQPAPSPQDPAGEGIPVTAPAEQAAFLERFEGQEVAQQACPYNPATRLADCAGYAVYAPDPPLAGQDISCFVLIVNGEPAALRCTSQEPLETLYYEIS
jgi:hypothetical protein